MDTNKLKSFAQEARRDLKQQISSKLLRVLAADSLAQRENPQAIKKLKEDIAKHSEDIIIEKVAYTWFNRIMALRFMDVNHYTQVGIVSPLEGNIIPEILADAKESHFAPDLIKEESAKRISSLLLGSIPSNNAQQEAYQIILVNACNYYHRLLPFLFEEITDYTELLLPDDLLSDKSIISKTRETLTAENCSQVEVIGWLYQFYISEKKDKVMAASKASKSNKSYKSEDIPAVTQLFTPHWIVQYMVENSLGRLWLENHPNSSIKGEMKYYIEAEVSSNHLKISSPEEITFIDPCCGSGHILVYAFDLLTKIYEEEGYNKADIAQLILEKNLSGIDIDKRAGDLASFALIMRARDYHSRFLKHDLSQPNIITMKNCDLTEGQVKAFIDALGNPSFSKKTSTQATINTLNLQDTLTLLRQAETFGSLIQPKVASVEDIITAMEESELDQNLLYFETYQKLLTALQQIKYLQKQYHCVVTNPPYMGNKWLNKSLKDFLSTHYTDVKSDLFSAFIVRCLKMTKKSGKLGFMTPFVWMFISSYEKLRNKLIDKTNITSLVQLEYSGFDGATVPICTFTLENRFDKSFQGGYIKLSDFRGSQNQAPKTLQAIQNHKCGWYYTTNQEDFKKIPGSPIAYWVSQKV
ncbi:MAG: BREX-1 system adenine-specific DNA-methyltransferase PglX, partial [Candidatus Cloacimonadales bacterium]